jgi:hypothetical protein
MGFIAHAHALVLVAKGGSYREAAQGVTPYRTAVVLGV